MEQKPWRKWTDEEVRQALLADWGPQERWRIYGYIGDDGRPYEVTDDDDDRSERITAYLRKIGAPGI